MLSLVCILHSADGRYSGELCGDATSCVTAITRSVTASAQDMIPSVAVLRADPVAGVKYLYTSAVPDTNHAVEASEMYRAPYSPSLRLMNSALNPATSGGEDSEVFDFTNAFRGRSALFLSECIVYGTQARGAVPEDTDHFPFLANGDAGSGSSEREDEPGRKRRRRTAGAPLSTSPAAATDTEPWGPLAAALLSALAFLRKHAADGQDITTTTAASPTCGTNVNDGNPASATAAQQRRRNLIAVFTDCGGSVAPVSYSTECALAVAMAAASKGSAAIYCFGEGITPVSADTDKEKMTAKGVEYPDGAAARLRCMAASSGGACALHFHHGLIGTMLDGQQPPSSPPPAQQAASPPVAVMTTRAKRERIAEQYVVQPTVLAREPGKGEDEQVASAHTRAPTTKEERASNLGWLCPQCMAVVYRDRGEAQGSVAGEASKEAERVFCPYCV